MFIQCQPCSCLESFFGILVFAHGRVLIWGLHQFFFIMAFIVHNLDVSTQQAMYGLSYIALLPTMHTSSFPSNSTFRKTWTKSKTKMQTQITQRMCFTSYVYLPMAKSNQTPYLSIPITHVGCVLHVFCWFKSCFPNPSSEQVKWPDQMKINSNS